MGSLQHSIYLTDASSSVFFVSSKGHELDLFSIGSSRFESFLLLG